MRIGIKIINYKEDSYTWYENFLEEVFPLAFWDEAMDEPVVDKCNEKGELGSVKQGDYELIEFEDGVVIREKPVNLSETEKLKAELEMTQSALNEIIMNMMGGGF